MRLNERWHLSHEPLSSFFFGFLCSTCCDPEPLLLLLDDAVVKNCTSYGPVEKFMAASSPTQVA